MGDKKRQVPGAGWRLGILFAFFLSLLMAPHSQTPFLSPSSKPPLPQQLRSLLLKRMRFPTKSDSLPRPCEVHPDGNTDHSVFLLWLQVCRSQSLPPHVSQDKVSVYPLPRGAIVEGVCCFSPPVPTLLTSSFFLFCTLFFHVPQPSVLAFCWGLEDSFQMVLPLGRFPPHY